MRTQQSVVGEVLRRAVIPLGVLVLAASAGACAGGGSKSASARPSSPPSAKPSSVEQLAAVLGCTPRERGRASDYRQAFCETASGKYVIATFNTDQGQQDWTNFSKMYGGTYLVGPRWTVVAGPELLKPLQVRVGGRLEEGHTPGSTG